MSSNANEQRPLLQKQESHIKFARTITLLHAIGIILGTVIGSGIFVSPSGVLLYSGSVGMALIIWLFTGLYCIGQSLCYAELGTILPKAGGAYIYILNILGEVPAFLCAWIHIFVNSTSSLAVLARTFSMYLLEPFNISCSDDKLITATAIGMLITVSLLNARSVSLATKFQAFFAFSKVFAVFVVITVGFYHIITYGSATKDFKPYFRNFYSNGKINNSHSTFDLASCSRAVLQSYFAFKGWEHVATLPEEMVNPERDLPIAMVASVSVITVLYLIMNVAYFGILTPRQILKSHAVAQSFADKTFPGYISWIVPFVVALASLGSTNGSLIGDARFTFATGRSNQFPSIFGYIHYKYHTPIIAICLVCIIACLYSSIPSLGELLEYASMASQFKLLLVLIALVYLRFKRPDIERPFKVNIIIVFLTIGSLLIIVTLAFIKNPITLGACFGLLIVGFPMYFIGQKSRKWQFIKRFMLWLRIRIQLILLVVPLKKEMKSARLITFD